MKMGRGEPGVDSSDIVREEGSGKVPRAIWLEDSFLKFPILGSIKKKGIHMIESLSPGPSGQQNNTGTSFLIFTLEAKTKA